MSNTTRFTGQIAARARQIFSNVRITCGQNDRQIASALNPPMNPKTFSRILITEQSMSARQVRAGANFVAKQIGVSPDRILGYLRNPAAPAYVGIHEIAAAEIFRPTRKDLLCLRYRLARIEQTVETIRIFHRGIPSQLQTSTLVRKHVPDNLPRWTARILRAWSNERRRQFEARSGRCMIECCLMNSTLVDLRRSAGQFSCCTDEDKAEQIEHLVYDCVETKGVHIRVTTDANAGVTRVLDQAWAAFDSVTIYDDRAVLRRDRHGNRFLYDKAIRSDALSIIKHDEKNYERLTTYSTCLMDFEFPQ